MAAGTVDVVGSSPISFTNSKGEQKVIPLSALSFRGSDLRLKPEWAEVLELDANETETLLALARARVAGGELTPPPSPPPVPALAFTASHAGPESNGIKVWVTSEKGTPPPPSDDEDHRDRGGDRHLVGPSQRRRRCARDRCRRADRRTW